MSSDMDAESTPAAMSSNSHAETEPAPAIISSEMEHEPSPPPELSSEMDHESTQPAASLEMEFESIQAVIPLESNPEPQPAVVSSDAMDHEPTTTVRPEGSPEASSRASQPGNPDSSAPAISPPPQQNQETPAQTTTPSDGATETTPGTTSQNSDSESTAPTTTSESEEDENQETSPSSEDDDSSSTPTAKSSREELESQILAAAASGDVDLTKSLFPTDLLTKIASKGTKAGHPSILIWALENGLVLPAESTDNHVFQAAFEAGSIPVFEVLLERGVELEKHSSEYYGDALAHACMKGNLPLIKFLLEKGHGVNSGRRCNGRVGVVWAVTHDSFTPPEPLHKLEARGLEIIKVLLDHGLKVQGTGAAIAAAEKDNLEALQMLLDAGAGMEEVCNWRSVEKDRDEGTALFRACLRGRERTVDYLLGRGAKRDVYSWEGRGCHEVAESKGYKGVVSLLEVMGVTVEWPD